MTITNLTTRNATLEDLATMLQQQQAMKHDVVLSANRVSSVGGTWMAQEPVLDADGVGTGSFLYTPTRTADSGIAEKLGIPVGYLRRMRETRPDLYDANVNGWLHGGESGGTTFDTDARSFLLRTFRAADAQPDDITSPGVARAFLSDSYAVIDHLDALTAALEGIHLADAEIQVDSADLTENRMVVRLSCPKITALAPTLLSDYRSPFTGESGNDLPVVWAGLQLSNSETGGGAFTITPRFVVQICRNGVTITRDAMRAVHLGGKLDDGVIRWSAETQSKQLDLVKAKAVDATRTFLDVGYMQRVVTKLEAEAGKPVETVDEVRDVTKGLSFTQEHTDGVLGFFIRGGQMTVGGVSNAITAYAQTVADGDEAFNLEAAAVQLLGNPSGKLATSGTA